MDSDEDQLLLSNPEEPSPQLHNRRLKRLKKSTSKSPFLDQIDDHLLFSSVDFAKLEALENDSETIDFNYLNSNGNPFSSQESLSHGITNEDVDDKEGEMRFDVVRKTKRVLEFDDDVMNSADVNGERNGQENLDSRKERRSGDENLLEEKEVSKKKKRTKRDSGNESKTKAPKNKRKDEKERQAYLKDLHAESQRLLRETRNATFKPVPVVQKPISSVLEKIRKRKLELSKKSKNYEANISPLDEKLDHDVSNEYEMEQTVAKEVVKDKLAPCIDGESSIDAPNVEETKDAPKQTSHKNDCDPLSLNEVPVHVFREPVYDTQDLFDDSEPHGTSPEQQDEQLNSLLEEEFAPLLAMNLTLDSAPVDSSSDEEDNDKENINPHPYRITESRSSPKGDPVKGFLDDEAEEEDDSDNDLIRFKDDEEDEDIDDREELVNMIASMYEERPVDNERRNELHQKWLEQQDVAENENLMQRFNCGSDLRDTVLSHEEPESEEDEDFNDEVKEDSMRMNSARINIRKAKQIILQFPSDKDVYVSDDDEDTDRRHARSLLSRKEDQTTIVSPADDESSREVFGLIKKLNIVSDNKKKPKTSSFFDSVLRGGNSNSSSKSSFLGRASNHPMPSTHKKGSGTVRSFIFGRDDSNNRSSMSMSVSEDSIDTVYQEARPTKNFTAKYSNTQTKFNGRNRDTSAETASGTSLFDLLKKPSTQSQVCHVQNTVDLTKSIFAFRVPKKPVKIEGRS